MIVYEKSIKLFFDSRGNNYPYQKWLESLSDCEFDLVDRRIKRVSHGNYGDYKSLGGGILELRFHQGYRIYFTEVGNTIVILLCGGDKSSQEKDIAKAKEYKRILNSEGLDYYSRK
jgi:putative addiction module killer protein